MASSAVAANAAPAAAGSTKAEEKRLDDEGEEILPALDFAGKRKKKKKKADEDESAGPAGASPAGDVVVESSGSGSQKSADADYNYTELLDRVFSLLREKNPNLAGGRKRYTMPPPQLVRVGTRKTMWSNFTPICQVMARNTDHVLSFLLSELGTEGSIDANTRCVMKGRYQPKQIESILRKYISEYVTCHMCRNPETTLSRDPVTRLYFLQCTSCGSRRSVAPIKSGFHAAMRADRRKAKE